MHIETYFLCMITILLRNMFKSQGYRWVAGLLK